MLPQKIGQEVKLLTTEVRELPKTFLKYTNIRWRLRNQKKAVGLAVHVRKNVCQTCDCVTDAKLGIMKIVLGLQSRIKMSFSDRNVNRLH
nr:unnamed protein product [Callosobruchus chinensis]